jgi:hypothetical protein
MFNIKVLPQTTKNMQACSGGQEWFEKTYPKGRTIKSFFEEHANEPLDPQITSYLGWFLYRTNLPFPKYINKRCKAEIGVTWTCWMKSTFGYREIFERAYKYWSQEHER